MTLKWCFMSKKFHISLSVSDIKKSVTDYSIRLGCGPILVIDNEYALWRTDFLNFSIRKAEKPGTWRHVGWEDPQAQKFESEKDLNGLLWENFSAEHQAQEIRETWPNTEYEPDKT